MPNRLRYAFYPGCAAKGATPELYTATVAVAPLLGIELVELSDFNCCGAGVLNEADPDLGLALNARTFSAAEQLGLPLMTICGTCQGITSWANKTLTEDEATRERINKILRDSGVPPYNGTVEVLHLQWVLLRDVGVEELRRRVKRPLTELSIAPFYGCYILRPSKNLGFDDPEHPKSLETLIRALGARPVEYEGKTKCCGFPLIIEKEEIALSMIGQHVGEAKEKGGDLMVTPCPLCHMSLDIYQGRAEKKAERKLSMPILHLPQLLGLALGLTPKELGMERHLVPTDSISEKLS